MAEKENLKSNWITLFWKWTNNMLGVQYWGIRNRLESSLWVFKGEASIEAAQGQGQDRQLALSVTSCVTLDKYLKLSDSQFALL